MLTNIIFPQYFKMANLLLRNTGAAFSRSRSDRCVPSLISNVGIFIVS